MKNACKVGYKEDDIRAFLPRSVRNVENAEAHVCVQLYKHQGWGATPSLILFCTLQNLFKPRQHRLAVVWLLTSSVLSTTLKTVFWADFVSFICNLKAVLEQPGLVS